MIDDLPDPDRPLRIGTRGSPLALAQAHGLLHKFAVIRLVLGLIPAMQ